MNILIVGGGASGTITAIALQRAGISPVSIDIAEPRQLLGEGLAYQTRDALHRLNVPASRMSAIEDIPDDFQRWSDAPAYSFMERRTYSQYLRERLGADCGHIQEHVIDLDSTTEKVIATFASGSKGEYDAVVLAMGHGAARLPDFLKAHLGSKRVIVDVWDGGELPISQTLLCFGTGLSFIDIAMTHLSRGPENKVIAISGSGNLPERHVQNPITPFSPTLDQVSTLEKLRSYLSNAGDSWREAIDGLRPITEAMWRGFSQTEREEFLRTDGSSWSRRRHRIAPDVADQVDSYIASGRIQVIKGQINTLMESADEIRLELADGSSFSGEYLAICIGRAYELSDPLTLNLLEQKKALRGPLDMGLAVDVSTGLLLHPDSGAYPRIFAIGPLRSGEAFESTAIPEIRKQATAIAKAFLAR